MLTPPKRRWTRSQMPDTAPVYLTPEGIQRLRDRLARLKKDLPAFAEEAARTAAYGDRSDSSEYKEAKSILRRTHRQIFAIEDQLKRVVAIPSGPGAAGTVQLGSTVKLESSKGVVKTFRILGSSETNPGNRRISHVSPLGAALIGLSKGDEVVIATPNGKKKYRILEIS
jgi:transcription elongation factor GreB